MADLDERMEVKDPEETTHDIFGINLLFDPEYSDRNITISRAREFVAQHSNHGDSLDHHSLANADRETARQLRASLRALAEERSPEALPIARQVAALAPSTTPEPVRYLRAFAESEPELRWAAAGAAESVASYPYLTPWQRWWMLHLATSTSTASEAANLVSLLSSETGPDPDPIVAAQAVIARARHGLVDLDEVLQDILKREPVVEQWYIAAARLLLADADPVPKEVESYRKASPLAGVLL